MHGELSIGEYVQIKEYNYRKIITTTKYILVIPIREDRINGMVVAFHVHNGQLAWSCNYVDSLANGVYKYYKDDGQLQYSYLYIDPMFKLQETAIKCAELILS